MNQPLKARGVVYPVGAGLGRLGMGKPKRRKTPTLVSDPLIADTRSVRVAIKAGARPKIMPVATASGAVNASTRPSGVKSSETGS